MVDGARKVPEMTKCSPLKQVDMKYDSWVSKPQVCTPGIVKAKMEAWFRGRFSMIFIIVLVGSLDKLPPPVNHLLMAVRRLGVQHLHLLPDRSLHQHALPPTNHKMQAEKYKIQKYKNKKHQNKILGF